MVKRTISPRLRFVLESWMDWVNTGAPNRPDSVFSRHSGLCSTVARAAAAGGQNCVSVEFGKLLREDFAHLEDSLRHTPFNFDSEDYMEEVSVGESHKNAARISWVKKILEETK